MIPLQSYQCTILDLEINLYSKRIRGTDMVHCGMGSRFIKYLQEVAWNEEDGWDEQSVVSLGMCVIMLLHIDKDW